MLRVPDGLSRYHLRTLGTLGLSGAEDRLVLGAHGHHRRRLALLSVLAVARQQGRSRDQLLALFWPETTDSRARHSLDQLLYAVRSSVGEDVFAGVNPVRLNPNAVSTDVGIFMIALERGDDARAVMEYRGPFLDGFHLDDSPEFERWLETERVALAGRYSAALERLARRAEAAGGHEIAVQWWRKLVEVDPLSSRSAAGLVRALMNAGDQGAALRCAQRHEDLLARELGVSSGPDIAELVAELSRASRARPAIASMAVPAVALPAHAIGTAEPAGPIVSVTASISLPIEHREEPRVHRRRTLYAIGFSIPIAVFAAMLTIPRLGNGRLPPAPSAERARRDLTANVAAHELYLRANDPASTRSDSSVRAALGYFEQAIAIDPRYAAAYAGLARMQMTLAAIHKDTTVPRQERFRLAESAALKAVALDDSSAEAHAALSAVKRNNYEFASAEAELTRAVALEPATARYHEGLVQLYIWMDRPAEALVEGRRAIELDPLSPTANAELAHALLASGRCDEALAQLAPLRLLKPPLLRAAGIATQCYASEGMWSNAAAEAARNESKGGPAAQALLGFVLARAGRKAEAQRLLDSLLERSRRQDDVAGEIATVYAGLGDKEKTWAWLHHAREKRTLVLDHLSLIFDRLRPDPRVDAFRRELGLQNR
jgi:DNA-binding SARP family transcriptional activator